MSYTPYATQEDYAELFPDEASVTDTALREASRHIDTLTYNRIVAEGFDNLTEFQQTIIIEVCCRQALFETENADLISSVLSSYSINGVSMQFGGDGSNVYAENGVVMLKSSYGLLKQTGLCCRVLR